MFKKIKPNEVQTTRSIVSPTVQFPHCDQRILHAPGECQFCDEHPDWQFLREMWGICFTGYTPEGKELPCPADNTRGDKHKQWFGNTARLSEDN